MKNIPFRIAGIKVETFTLVSVPSDGSIEVRTSFGFGADAANHAVMCRAKYNYLQNESVLLEMVLVCAFDVKPEAFKDLTKDGKLVLDQYFSQYLATINVGTARGEIHSRCEIAGSTLAGVVLPPVNLTIALPDPIKIDLDGK